MKNFGNKLLNKKGEVSTKTVVLIMSILCLACLCFSYAVMQLDVLEIKKTVKQNVNNISAIIASDLYSAQKNKDIDEHIKQLNLSTDYTNYILQTVKDNIASELGLVDENNLLIRKENSTKRYTLYNFNISQEKEDDYIKFTVKFKVDMYYTLFSKPQCIATFNPSYCTYHKMNY